MENINLKLYQVIQLKIIVKDEAVEENASDEDLDTNKENSSDK